MIFSDEARAGFYLVLHLFSAEAVSVFYLVLLWNFQMKRKVLIFQVMIEKLLLGESQCSLPRVAIDVFIADGHSLSTLFCNCVLT